MGQAVKPNFEQYIRTVEDFPNPGIRFYDIAPLIGKGAVFGSLIETMSEPYKADLELTKIVSFDARGFIFGAAMAAELGLGCVLLRKPGKLPGETFQAGYELEYGSNTLEIQQDALSETDRVVLVDDVIATGGTALAGVELVQRCGSQIAEFCSVINLPQLGGSTQIEAVGVPVRSIMELGGNV